MYLCGTSVQVVCSNSVAYLGLSGKADYPFTAIGLLAVSHRSLPTALASVPISPNMRRRRANGAHRFLHSCFLLCCTFPPSQLAFLSPHRYRIHKRRRPDGWSPKRESPTTAMINLWPSSVYYRKYSFSSSTGAAAVRVRLFPSDRARGQASERTDAIIIYVDGERAICAPLSDPEETIFRLLTSLP